MILALTGLMGCGKSSAGRAAAKRLGVRFVDLDSEIEKHAGCSVAQIFAAEGEQGFRKRELEALSRLVSIPCAGFILALGGGTPTIAEARAVLAEKTKVVYIKASLPTLLSHLSGPVDSRPLLKEGKEEKLKALLDSRGPVYESVADAIIESDGLNVDQVAALIAAQFKQL